MPGARAVDVPFAARRVRLNIDHFAAGDAATATLTAGSTKIIALPQTSRQSQILLAMTRHEWGAQRRWTDGNALPIAALRSAARMG